MKKSVCFGCLAICLVALWIFALCGDAQAQGKGQKKGQSGKNKKKSEQVTEKQKNENATAGTVRDEKGKRKVDNKAKDRETSPEEEGGAKITPAKNAKYKPKRLTENDMMEWTDGNPPGWSRGRKTGWDGAGAPPGQMKKQGEQVRERDREMIHIYPPQAGEWDAKKKEEWDGSMKKMRTRIFERIKTRGDVPKEDEESAIISLERAAGKGVPIERTGDVIDNALSKRMRGEEIEKMTRAMSYGADKDTDYDKLGRFVNTKIDEGETGDDIALSVYKEIDEGTMAKKKPWYKRWFNR